MINFRLLEADEIECRVKKVIQKGAIILLYKTARTDMDLLDEAVSPENWESDYKEIKGNLYAGIGIRTENGVIWKWDCGIESREDGEGNQKKGEASDSFKRAGFKWGIGRELYTAPFIFIPADKMEIKDNKTFDTFSVQSITYDDKHRISALTIINDKTSSVCYSFNANSPKKDKESKKESKSEQDKPQTDVTFTNNAEELICEICHNEIKGLHTKDGDITAKEMADKSKEAYGMNLCAACSKVEKAKKAAQSTVETAAVHENK